MESTSTSIPLGGISIFSRSGENLEAVEAVVGIDNAVGNPEFSLPEADGGKEAWLFLAACFMIEALVWGMSGIPKPQHRWSLLSQEPYDFMPSLEHRKPE